MATLIHADGKEEVVQPANGVGFTLEEAQKHVGGWVELIAIDQDRTMVINEEGKLENLPVNYTATNMVRHLIDGGDFVVGNVLIIHPSEFD